MNTLLPIVRQCTLNQTRKYWLLSNVLIFVFNLFNAMKTNLANIESLNWPLICGDFDHIKNASTFLKMSITCISYGCILN
jgi:hypothetical protein